MPELKVNRALALEVWTQVDQGTPPKAMRLSIKISTRTIGRLCRAKRTFENGGAPGTLTEGSRWSLESIRQLKQWFGEYLAQSGKVGQSQPYPRPRDSDEEPLGKSFTDSAQGTPIQFLRREAQDRHIQEVLRELQKLRPRLLSPRDIVPREDGLGILTHQAALSQDAEQDLSVAQFINLSEEAAQHLKGTKAKDVLDAALQEITPYYRRCLGLWRSIRTSLAHECDLPVRWLPWPFQGPLASPFLHALLVDTVYLMLFEFTHGARGLQPDQSWWSQSASPDGLPTLLFRQSAAAIGIPADSSLVQHTQDGVARCVKDTFAKHEGEARELERLHHPLVYIAGTVQDQFQNLQAEEVRRGICPVCPYPEAAEAAIVKSIGTAEVAENQGSG